MEIEDYDEDISFEDFLMHYGVKRRSGRYPWGSGENPYQHSGDFVSRVKELRSQGLGEKDIAKAMGFDYTTDFRSAYSIAKNEQRRLKVDRAKSLRDDGMSTTDIAREMGVNESTVRSWFNEKSEARMNATTKTAEVLKNMIEEKGMLDVGAGAELELGVSKKTLNDALSMLEYEGYNVYGVGIPQVTNKGRQSNAKVLTKGDVQYKDVYQNMGDIQSVGDYHSRDGGQRWDHREYPASIDSKRIAIRYGDEGGLDKDGVIEIRRGVKDLDLGPSHYAQVRIMVDGTHYLKGMAMYSDDIPDGTDIVFNTNKKSGTPKTDVMKAIKDDPNNPFGAYIKRGGQSFYPDKNGKYTDPITGEKCSLSAINKLKEEGDWDTMSRNLSSQFLSKQPLSLIKKQLDLTYSDYQSEFDEINSLTNPTVKKKLLQDFAQGCDAAAIHMQAAALPRQSTRVILPVSHLKDNECYAPYLRDGEKVCLVRYPHGGTFEIPYLTVNNKNKDAKRILGPDVQDAIGINSKVAEQLSGADFDGDQVVVIPVNSRVKVTHRSPLKDLADFDPKIEYASVKKTENGKEVYYNQTGQKIKIMNDGKQKQQQMGMISNLITDMTLRGAEDDELARAVKHSMVVIDAPKHKLDYKQSEKDNGISELRKKYQVKYDKDGNVIGYGGASTLLSRRKTTTEVPERRGAGRIDPETGKMVYKESGRTYVNKKGETVQATTSVPLVSQVEDVRNLSSGTFQEEAYADYSNKMKALANTARKTLLSTPNLERSPSATKIYAAEVASLNEKLKTSLKNAPKERRAQAIANSVVRAKKQSNPELGDSNNKKELQKIERYAIEDARASVGADSAGAKIKITDSEWNAIQAGAISDTKLREILRYADSDRVRELAMPKTTTQLSPAKLGTLQAMRNSGYTIAQIAERLGVSTSTVSKYLNN